MNLRRWLIVAALVAAIIAAGYDRIDYTAISVAIFAVISVIEISKR